MLSSHQDTGRLGGFGVVATANVGVLQNLVMTWHIFRTGSCLSMLLLLLLLLVMLLLLDHVITM